MSNVHSNRGQRPGKKASLNYWVDVGIGVSFVLSAISGLIFLLPVSSDPSLGSRFLGISYTLWDELHTLSSLGLIAGVLAHLVLHWKWIVGMTKNLLPFRRVPQENVAPAPGTKAACVTRRQFLHLGLVTIAAGVITAGYTLMFGVEAADSEQEDSDSSPLQYDSGQSVQGQLGVACPRGLVNDPYPGRCRHYTDGNGDGICDYSVPGSGNN